MATGKRLPSRRSKGNRSVTGRRSLPQ